MAGKGRQGKELNVHMVGTLCVAFVAVAGAALGDDAVPILRPNWLIRTLGVLNGEGQLRAQDLSLGPAGGTLDDPAGARMLFSGVMARSAPASRIPSDELTMEAVAWIGQNFPNPRDCTVDFNGGAGSDQDIEAFFACVSSDGDAGAEIESFFRVLAVNPG